nr:hypothetical protein SHINE37_43525 [Rhizobiaceae bacterium]
MSGGMRLTIYATLELWKFLNDTCVGVTIRSVVSMIRTAFIGSAASGTQGMFCRRQPVDVRRAVAKRRRTLDFQSLLWLLAFVRFVVCSHGVCPGYGRLLPRPRRRGGAGSRPACVQNGSIRDIRRA